MAIIKAVNSRASIANAIRYITKDSKTEFDLVSGINCSPDSAITQMKLTKALWSKTKGRQYKHFIQSFPKDEKITPEEAHQIASELMERWDIAKGYEVIFATHIDKGHIHTHFILNSVSCENGRKFRYSKRDFSKFRELSDRILTEHNKSICEKNNEITTYNIGAYKAMQKALAGKYDSWLLAVALAVRAAKAAAKTKEEFISILSEKNISVTWNSRKYITFTDKDGHKVRNKKLTETFKEDFSKEGLENEFKRNSTAAIDQAERERQERELAEFYAEFMQREQNDEGAAEELGDGIDEPEEEVNMVMAEGSTNQTELQRDLLMNMYIPLPTIEIQAKITNFLDEKCAEIDLLVNDIQQQIEVLEKYKKSIVFKIVSEGISNKKLKTTNSSIWKKTPVNWKLCDIKYVFEIVKRIAGKEGFDILSVTQSGLKIKDINDNSGQLAENYSNYQFVYPTDYVMNHMDLLTGWVDCSNLFGVTSPDYRVFRLRDKEKNDLSYFKHLMQCCYMCKIFYSLGQGVSNTGRWRLQTSTFMNFKIPVPPLDEQRKISSFLNEKIEQIDNIIIDKQKQLKELDVYKKTIIYEYVTGKAEMKL